MKRSLVCFSIALMLFVFASRLQAAPSTGLLDDGEFNDPDPSSDVTNSDWVLNTNKPDGVDLAARFQFSGFSRSDGAPGSGSGLWVRTFEGEQDPGDDPAEFDLTQSIVAPSSGDYSLSVDWARELDFMADTFGITLENVTAATSASVDLKTAVAASGDNFNELLSSNGGPNVAVIPLGGVSAGDTLKVTAFMTGGTNVNPSSFGVSAFLDNFVLTVVPEPSSVMLMVMGMVGLLARRRNR